MSVGREGKLEALEKNWEQQGPRFAVIYGSHRLGKTTLLSEFAKGKRGIFFSAQRLNSFENLRIFEKAVSGFSGEEEHFEHWKDAFARIAVVAGSERFLLSIDDFSDLVFEDKQILKAFRNAFENEWRNSNIFVATTGGRVFFTETEITVENSAASMRRPLIYKLDELDYLDSAKCLPGNISAQDKMRYYCCLGGVPEYLNFVNGELSFEQNIRKIFFEKNSPLADILPIIYLDELREPEFYNSILYSLAKGNRRINEIVAETGESSTKVNKYLLTLLQMQIVSRDIPFGEEVGSSRKGVYSITTKALAFWYRFVLPNKTAISLGEPVLPDLEKEVDEYLGGKNFEQICLQYMNRKNKQGMLPFLGNTVSGYWSSLKEKSDSKLVVANQRNRQILFAVCKDEFTEPAESFVGSLSETDKLFTEYWERYNMLFSMKPFGREYKNMENMKLRLVDAEMLFK